MCFGGKGWTLFVVVAWVHDDDDETVREDGSAVDAHEAAEQRDDRHD